MLNVLCLGVSDVPWMKAMTAASRLPFRLLPLWWREQRSRGLPAENGYSADNGTVKGIPGGARLWHPWLRINRVMRVMLHTRWSAEPSRQTRKPLNVKRVARRFRRILTRAELGPFRPYDLRHSY